MDALSTLATTKRSAVLNTGVSASIETFLRCHKSPDIKEHALHTSLNVLWETVQEGEMLEQCLERAWDVFEGWVNDAVRGAIWNPAQHVHKEKMVPIELQDIFESTEVMDKVMEARSYYLQQLTEDKSDHPWFVNFKEFSMAADGLAMCDVVMQGQGDWVRMWSFWL